MKKLVIVAIVTMFLAVVAGAGMEGDAIDANGNWFDEGTQVGYDTVKGYYWIMDSAKNYAPWEREEMKIADSYTATLFRLSDETLEYLTKGAH